MDEKRRRAERNESILRTLERIDYQATTLAAKTERLRALKVRACYMKNSSLVMFMDFKILFIAVLLSTLLPRRVEAIRAIFTKLVEPSSAWDVSVDDEPQRQHN